MTTLPDPSTGSSPATAAVAPQLPAARGVEVPATPGGAALDTTLGLRAWHQKQRLLHQKAVGWD